MGEYLKINGEEVKIGTCESMYYARYSQLKKLADAGHKEAATYVDPSIRILYRFPFPDEDGTNIGTYDNFAYDRGVSLYLPSSLKAFEGATWRDVTGHLQTDAGNVFATAPNPNATLSTVSIALTQQRYMDGKLVPVFRCMYSRGYFRIEDEAEVQEIADTVREYNPKNSDLLEIMHRMVEGMQGVIF